MATPEAKVKRAIKKIVVSYGEQIWSFWPVQTGFGRRTVDLHMCVRGRFFAVEVKPPGKKPTPLQDRELCSVTLAGGVSTWVDNAPAFQALLDTTFPDLVPLS